MMASKVAIYFRQGIHQLVRTKNGSWLVFAQLNEALSGLATSILFVRFRLYIRSTISFSRLVEPLYLAESFRRKSEWTRGCQ